jgi:DNA-binding CsgD family transcriptional regulator
MARSATQAHGHVAALASADLPLHELGAELSAALSGLLPHEGYALIGFDPVSGLRTFQTDRNTLVGDVAPLVRNEIVEHDLHRFTELASRPNPVGTLGGGAPGEERSTRLHKLLAEQGFSRELRLALRGRGTLWGALVLLRERGRPPFTDEEAIVATAIAQPLTQAVKRVSVRPYGQPLPPLPPGVVLVGPDDTAEAISPQAAAWLSDLYPTPHPLSYIVLLAAAAARNKHGARADQLARIRTRSGRWLCLAACPLGSDRVAVVLQPATTGQLLPALAAWHEFTPRQLDVVHLLLQAHSIKQIARRLELSPHTVEDHLKTLYRKTGTNSQQELIAALR